MARDAKHLPADMKKRLDRIESGIKKSERDTERAAAIAAKQVQESEMKKDAGGDLRLSRVRSGKGARIGARYFYWNGDMLVRAIGPVPLIANDMPEHRIPKVRARRARRRLAIAGLADSSTGDAGIRASVNHPGTRGKDTWNDGRVKAVPVIRTIIGKKSDATVVAAFKAGI